MQLRIFLPLVVLVAAVLLSQTRSGIAGHDSSGQEHSQAHDVKVSSSSSSSSSSSTSSNSDSNNNTDFPYSSSTRGQLSYKPVLRTVAYRGLFETTLETSHTLRSGSGISNSNSNSKDKDNDKDKNSIQDKILDNSYIKSINAYTTNVYVQNRQPNTNISISPGGHAFSPMGVDTNLPGPNIKVPPDVPEPIPRKSPNCSLAKYQEWRGLKYTGYLASDPTFWMYQAATFFILTNGMAIEMAAAKCKDRFKILYTFKAGKSGPIDLQTCYKAMCTDVCMQNDIMHIQAMEYSGCNCFELSTSEDSPTYSLRGDWCEQNSARILCNVVGYCGVWGCRLDDYMCPRFEWNKKIIPIKGPGTCIKGVVGAASSKYTAVSTTFVIVISIILGLFFAF